MGGQFCLVLRGQQLLARGDHGIGQALRDFGSETQRTHQGSDFHAGAREPVLGTQERGLRLGALQSDFLFLSEIAQVGDFFDG